MSNRTDPILTRHGYLLLLPPGIGDAVMIGASMIDQITKHDLTAWGKIDIVCTEMQAEIFRFDPRVGKIILIPADIFATPHVATWRKGIFFTRATRELLQIINRRAYQAYSEEQNIAIFSNKARIIALFGGTHPGLFGYDKQSVIVGRGRKEQTRLVPGFFKEAYLRQRADWFDHITPRQLAEVILDQLTAPLEAYFVQTKETREERSC